MTTTAQFKTDCTAYYTVRDVDATEAANVGCPGATTQVVGHNFTCYGFFMATGTTPGREGRVPGWSTRRGVRALFVPAVVDEWSGTTPLAGYLTTDDNR